MLLHTSRLVKRTPPSTPQTQVFEGLGADFGGSAFIALLSEPQMKLNPVNRGTWLQTLSSIAAMVSKDLVELEAWL